MTRDATQTTEAIQPVKVPTLSFFTPEVTSYFIGECRFIANRAFCNERLAGGCAGAASRTVVSPLERLKIIQQVQPRSSEQQYKGVWRSLVRMWQEEGFRGYMRGNGINCLRIVPYSAVQFTTYEQLKKLFTSHGTGELDTPKRLAAGALAGIASVLSFLSIFLSLKATKGGMSPYIFVLSSAHMMGSCTASCYANQCFAGSTYPLDLVRARLSIATASIPVSLQSKSTTSLASSTISTSPLKHTLSTAYHTSASGSNYTASELTIWGMTLKIVREEGGIRGLYRGLIATAVGVAPYVGINFAAYEFFRGVITPPGKSSVSRKLACGALAGSISQTLTYPFDVLRRKMQVTGMRSSGLGIAYTGAFDALTGIVKTEGVRGLYRGLWPNLLKVAPSIATSFFTYELVKEFLVGP
ncbi:mitochondrial carrier domain-containing protein [Armillaria novae-zelandiae]|uniref:Mitochondrial carrier domain-containing protein n=1 Tax=Armillaria novae-zelandiae TaxID=153914 RepID=A0AA39UBX4_9AGAR|nr:mitochondrial carrier domain-containing protein [Armillaria novae-zelandiae]